MRILLFAGCHDNPVHRRNLHRRLTDLHQNGEVPKFIAVEANRALFQSVITFQREAFYKKAKNDDIFKELNLKYLKELSSAISYEADTHSEVFNDFNQLLWLDDVRPDFNAGNDPCRLAQRYLETCRCAVVESKLKITSSLRKYELFKAVDDYIASPDRSEKNVYGVSGINTTFERDKAWKKMLDPYLSQDERTDFGIAIIGENHAKDEPAYLRYLLSKSGHLCEVELLREEPQPVNSADPKGRAAD